MVRGDHEERIVHRPGIEAAPSRVRPGGRVRHLQQEALIGLLHGPTVTAPALVVEGGKVHPLIAYWRPEGRYWYGTCGSPTCSRWREALGSSRVRSRRESAAPRRCGCRSSPPPPPAVPRAGPGLGRGSLRSFGRPRAAGARGRRARAGGETRRSGRPPGHGAESPTAAAAPPAEPLGQRLVTGSSTLKWYPAPAS